MTFNEKDKVTVAPEILQDQAYKTNFHLLERIINTHEVGYIRNMDLPLSKETKLNYYWAQFHVAAIRMEEKYLLSAEEKEQAL